MKYDFVKYRFPGKEIAVKRGEFIRLTPNQKPNGFVFSDFTGNFVYELKEDELIEDFQFDEEKLHYFSMKPYVVTPREYYLQAHELLNGINVMQMGKAVFSRIKLQTFTPSKLEKMFLALCEKYPSASVYMVSSKFFGTWIGASPELLLEIHGQHFFTMSLAGTQATAELGDWGEKEKEEQSLVTDYIVENLEKLDIEDIELNGPYTFQAGPVSHLRTDISASVIGVNSWKLIQMLHPTPAVSGFPKEDALALIETVEPHRRDLYAGFFGIISPEKTRLFVNLRCAQLQQDKMYLYLGGGFTRQSIPENEWIETENKSKTLLDIIEKL
jgi:isochorismate synthase